MERAGRGGGEADADTGHARRIRVTRARSCGPRVAASAGGEAQDQLRGLERDVELRAVADAVELDPVGVRQPVVAVARGRRRPRRAAGPRSPRRPAPGSRSARRRARQPSRRANSTIGATALAGRDADHQVGDQLGRDVLEVGGDVLAWRGAGPRRWRRSRRRAARRPRPAPASSVKKSSVSCNDSSPAAQPPAGASATTDSARPRAASCSAT